MAHRLVPKSGNHFLPPSEVVERFQEEFAFVDADRDAGSNHVGDMIAQFLRMKMAREIIDRFVRIQGEAVHVIVSDDPSSEEMQLSFCAIPDEDLFIGYHSAEHENAARPLLERCAAVLDYDIVEV